MDKKNSHPRTGLFSAAAWTKGLRLLALCGSVLLFFSCEDETEDFTAGSFYPFEPDPAGPTDPTGQDTTLTQDAACWSDPIEVVPATDFNAHFTRYGNGWTGGDATYSIALPDGRTLWLFGDSFMGIVNPDRSRPPSAFHRNAFVLQDGDEFTTLQGGATAFVEPQENGWWYWPGHGLARGDTLQVVLFAFRSTGSGGAWDFEYAAVDIATFRLPELSLLSIQRMVEQPTVNFGACLLDGEDGHIYLYGAEKDGFSKYLHVARVAGTDLTAPWTYFDGTGWTTEAAASQRLFANVSEQFTVFRRNQQFHLLTQHHILGGEIYLYDGASATGGFDNKRLVYCTPQSDQPNLFTYNAFAHTSFSSGDDMLVSYNVNSHAFADLFKNADTYRPFFVRISGAY